MNQFSLSLSLSPQRKVRILEKMTIRFCLYLILLWASLLSEATAATDSHEVIVLQDLYKALNGPPQLKGWKANGGDPCGESWTGVSCSSSSIVNLTLTALNLSGYLGGQLNNLQNLRHLDISSNSITGEIPRALPANATHINMACNNLNQSIPHSLPEVTNLRHLNLSHNLLSGTVGDVFIGLSNLKEMDLSYNNLTGDLPSSFGTLKNLNRLFLQENKFSGSVIYLAELPLVDLNIADNNFSGILPSQFKSITNLWFWGNRFHIAPNYPPWDYPSDSIPAKQNFSKPPTTGSSAIEQNVSGSPTTGSSATEKNLSRPPTTESSAIQNYPSFVSGRHKKRRLGLGGIAFMVGGIALLATCAVLLILIWNNLSRARILENLNSSNSCQHSSKDCPPTTTEGVFHSLTVNSSVPTNIATLCPTRKEGTFRTGHFSKQCECSTTAILFTLADLQQATNIFSQENLIGEGSLGSVYRAKLPNDQVVAVKSINMGSLTFHEEEHIMEVIWTASQLRHPNLVTLLGYCLEHGQHLIVYEYVQSLSLDDILHSGACKRLPWAIRLCLALGIARGLDYLHSAFSPPVAHCNLKAANILIDEDLTPRICDSGLAVLRPLTSNVVKIKASEIAVSNAGYIAPEHLQQGNGNTKGDVFAFGVLLLELLTGRRPFDGSRPESEQSLVKWASMQLHDSESLEQMVDPGIRKMPDPRDLSRFADVVSLCIQPVMEYRPEMSVAVESLTQLVQKISKAETGEMDMQERSFCSTLTRFRGSPSMIHSSP